MVILRLRHFDGGGYGNCSATTDTCPEPAPESTPVPPYMNIIVGSPPPAETAKEDILALNAAMFGLYGNSGKVFQRNILSQHPIILALFSGAGGRFILYRPGQQPLEAPSVPIAYQLLKSVGHSSMVLPVMVGPYIDKPASQSWHGPMQGFRAQLKAALDGVDLDGYAAGMARRGPRHPSGQYRLRRRELEPWCDHLRRRSKSSPASRRRS